MLGVIKTDTVLAAATTIQLNYLFACINSRATGANYTVSTIGQMKPKR
jgi:hypothetical protein